MSTAAATVRNRLVREQLATALRPVNLRGAPAMPVRGGLAQQPKKQQARKSDDGTLPVSDVLGRYAFTSASPKSHNAKLTRLAALAFGGGLAESTAAVDAAASVASMQGLNGAFLAALGPGQLHGIKAQLEEYASSTLLSGFTWLAVRAGSDTVEVINTPAHVSVLQLGYFPLACIDMTPEAYLVVPAEAGLDQSTTAQQQAAPPAWSRAARNASITYSVPTALSVEDAPHRTAPRERRAAHAADAVARVDWGYVQAQHTKATSWFTSEARAAARATRVASLEQKAKDVLPKRSVATDVEDDGAALPPPAAAGDEAAAPAVAAGDEQQQQQQSATTAASSDADNNAAADIDAQALRDGAAAEAAVADAQAAAEQQQAAAAATDVDDVEMPTAARPMPVGEGQQLDDGSVLYELEGGAQEFVREDGTRVVVRVDGTQEEYSADGLVSFIVKTDGTQVWPSHEAGGDLRRTIIAPDGTTTYEYKTGSKIIMLPDGRRQTVFSDGSVIEEPAPAAA